MPSIHVISMGGNALFTASLNLDDSLGTVAKDAAECLQVPHCEFILQGGRKLNMSETFEALQLNNGDTITAAASDPRTTSEKNCILLDALLEHRFDDAIAVMNSGGFPVNVNCVHKWDSPKNSFIHQDANSRNWEDVSASVDPALAIAIKALKTWNDQGNVSGPGADGAEVLPVIRELLQHGADANTSGSDTLTHGSWGSVGRSRSPLFLAVQVGSLEIAKLLLEAGADPESANLSESPGIGRPKTVSWKTELEDQFTMGTLSVEEKTEWLMTFSCDAGNGA